MNNLITTKNLIGKQITELPIEEKILWLAWNRFPDCKELFQEIKQEMFVTKELGEIYQMIKTGNMSYETGAIEKVIYTLMQYGILDAEEIYIPLIVPQLKKSLLNRWKWVRGQELMNRAYNSLKEGEDVSHILDEFKKIEANFTRKQSTLKDHFEDIAEDHERGTVKGLPTGIAYIDQTTQQLKKGHFWVIAAATNTGKTTLTLQIARNVLAQGAKVDFISLEMSARQLLERLTWLEASKERIKFERAISRLIDLPLTVTENLRTVEDLRAHIDSSEADLIILDYIQLVRGGKSYFDEATLTSNMLQEMAIKKMIPIIALSQVTKESAKAGPSIHMDFKNSGAIAESADVAIEIYRQRDNEAELAEAHLTLKKNRHGRIGDCEVTFDNTRGYFIF